MIDKELLEILACPACKAEVRLDEPAQRIVCTQCGRRYPIREGIFYLRPDDGILP